MEKESNFKEELEKVIEEFDNNILDSYGTSLGIDLKLYLNNKVNEKFDEFIKRINKEFDYELSESDEPISEETVSVLKVLKYKIDKLAGFENGKRI